MYFFFKKCYNKGVPTAVAEELITILSRKSKSVNRKDMKNMTEENKKLLARINSYAEDALGETDPQKVPVSVRLEKLKPVMEEIAKERNVSLEDIFILYMDLQSEATLSAQQKLEESLRDINDGPDGGMPLLFR